MYRVPTVINSRMTEAAWALVLSVIGFIALGQATYAQDSDQSLKLYAVHILDGTSPIGHGNGVYLGRGLVITAAHVAAPYLKAITIGIGAQRLPAQVLKRGDFSTVDLALLSFDDHYLPVSLRLRRMSLCNKPPSTGENVIVATPEDVVPSHIIAPILLPPKLDPKYRTAISDVATTGNSGSGVFDAENKCLLGIISAKISDVRGKTENGQVVAQQKTDVAKYFVPSTVIAEFIPPRTPH
jgi:Trypsin-like peptidase domain